MQDLKDFFANGLTFFAIQINVGELLGLISFNGVGTFVISLVVIRYWWFRGNKEKARKANEEYFYNKRLEKELKSKKKCK